MDSKIKFFNYLEEIFIKSFFVTHNFKCCFKQSGFHWSQKLFVMLLSVAIASKWDKPEKIKIFMVLTVKKRCCTALSQKEGTIAQFLKKNTVGHIIQCFSCNQIIFVYIKQDVWF